LQNGKQAPNQPFVNVTIQGAKPMPELYGQPYKHELRTEIQQLRTELWNLRKEHRDTRTALRYNQYKVQELEAKLERIKSAVGSILSDIDQDVSAAVSERFIKRKLG
jgi:predicted  nucleic acid-binding Zn-ribbon protein